MSNTLAYEMLAEDRGVIAYRPKLNELTGGVLGTIFLQQVVYWFKQSGDCPFYKFNEPCGHEKYREGDSWTEELGFTLRELRRARRKVAAKVTRGASKRELEQEHLVLYWTDGDRLTWYELNVELLCKSASVIYIANGEPGVTKENPESGVTYSSAETTPENNNTARGAEAVVVEDVGKDAQEAAALLTGVGVIESVAHNLAGAHGLERVHQVCYIAENNSNVRDPAGWTVNALRQGHDLGTTVPEHLQEYTYEQIERFVAAGAESEHFYAYGRKNGTDIFKYVDPAQKQKNTPA